MDLLSRQDIRKKTDKLNWRDMEISIVICTYNRSSLLADVLDTLCKQDADPDEFEIVVVDNNSSDRTKETTFQFVETHRNMRFILEPRQGISYARNRGWAESKGNYIAYVDDDCRIPPSWVRVAQRIIREHRPAMTGGPSFPFFLAEKPEWYKTEYGTRVITDIARPLKKKEYLAGLNFIFRKDILETLGGFDIRLGMNGGRIAYGEDIAVQMTLRKNMPDEIIYYDPELFVYHLVRAEKMTLPWLFRSFFAKGRYVYVLKNIDRHPTSKLKLLLRCTKILIHLLLDLSFGLVGRDRNKFPFPQNYLYERTSQYLRGLGRVYAQYFQL